MELSSALNRNCSY